MTESRKTHKLAAMPNSTKMESLFATQIYRAQLPARLNTDLAKTCLSLAAEDRAGQRWSKQHRYRGYTSYASLDDLPQRASVFADLVSTIDQQVRAFAKALDYTLTKPILDSLWVNVMDEGAVHTGHIHPHSAISGTYYVALPKNASAIRFEDPRLPLMMSAPLKRENAKRYNQPFVTVVPKPGMLLLWESFLRHEVPQNNARGKRISVSFNYNMR